MRKEVSNDSCHLSIQMCHIKIPIKGIQIEKEDIKSPLSTDDMSIYTENPEELPRNANKGSKLSDCWI